MKRMTAAV